MKLPESFTTVTPQSKLIALILFVSLPFIGFYFGLRYGQSLSIPSDQTTSAAVSPVPSVVKNPHSVLIYSEKISEQVDSGRSWSTVRISRVTDHGQPEVLIPSIGQVGEYPSTFVLSPDKQSLLINLEKRLVKLDLNTKKLTGLFDFINGGNYHGVAFSPDSRQLFVWDQPYVKDNYSVYIYDLSTGQKIIKHVIRPPEIKSSLMAVNWRPDNKVILEEPLGEAANLWVYDLNTNILEKKSDFFDRISQSGNLMAVPNAAVPNPCNGMGDDIGGFKFIDPVTLSVKDMINGQGRVARLLGISPDGSQVLYALLNPLGAKTISDYNECTKLTSDQEKSIQYFVKSIGDTPSQVAGYQTILQSWNIIDTNELGTNPDGSNYIQFGGQKITGTTNKSQLEIISQYNL